MFMTTSISGSSSAPRAPFAGGKAFVGAETAAYPNNMDPGIAVYQMTQSLQMSGKEEYTMFCAIEPGYIPITARLDVSGIKEWEEELSYVKAGCKFLEKGGKSYLVTARVSESKVNELLKKPWVYNLKISQLVTGAVRTTIHDIGLAKCMTKYRGAEGGKQGENTVIGVVDFSGDFNHQHFKVNGGGFWKTRILSIWEQEGNPVDGDEIVEAPYNYGRHYSEEQINKALNCGGDSHDYLGYQPAASAHGTHVMSIASQVAPRAKLIFVDLGGKKLGPNHSSRGGFGDSVRVIEAMKYIFEKAGDQPCVINLSLGTNLGGHDGTNDIEGALDILVKQKSNRAVVIAAANAYDEKLHASGEVEDAPSNIVWKFPPQEETRVHRMQIWYSKDDCLSLKIFDSNRQKIASGFDLEESRHLYDVDGTKIGGVFHQSSGNNEPKRRTDKYFDIFRVVSETKREDQWILELKGKTERYHAWIERFDGLKRCQSTFVESDSRYTLGSLSTAYKSIVVGSYNATKDGDLKPISEFSSSGPTRDRRSPRRQKPDISAPGQHVLAANSRTPNGLTMMNGTRMAAPVVTGIAVQMLSETYARGIDLTHRQIRERLKETCRDRKGWHEQFGHGKVSAEAIFSEL
jgi:subtilisin family serine protease